jgi:hypothetical protein
VYPLYFAGKTARREGDRDYGAEARLFKLMVADETLQEFKRVSAEKALYDRDVIDVRPRPIGSELRRLDPEKFDRWAVLAQRRDALARSLFEIHRPSRSVVVE